MAHPQETQEVRRVSFVDLSVPKHPVTTVAEQTEQVRKEEPDLVGKPFFDFFQAYKIMVKLNQDHYRKGISRISYCILCDISGYPCYYRVIKMEQPIPFDHEYIV